MEFIRDAACYRVYFPEQLVAAQVVLSGIQVEGFKGGEAAEPLALEAKYFIEVRILNRELNIRIEGCDEFGKILASAVHPNGRNIAILLLQNGFAKTLDWSLKMVENQAEYRETQKQAQKDKLRRWKVRVFIF